MATMTVHIVLGGTPYRTETGTIQTSQEGHMFFELSGQTGQLNDSWGYQPSGVIPGEAHNYYQRDVSISFDVSDAQAQQVRDFATNAENQGYGQWLPGHSCVDFAFDALRQAGITPADTWNPAAIFPGYNVDRLKETYYQYLSQPQFNREARPINPTTSTDFNAARAWAAPRRDPLILDLNGNGIETVAPNAANPILFDLNGNGIKTGTGWVAATDGFLVLDRNGNGTIDNGTELFGDSTQLAAGGNAADGFAALAGQDSNADGVVNALDANFASLKVWQDLNQDGISQAGELKTLAELGIASLNLAKTANSQTLTGGNQIADLGSFTRTDGTTAVMADVNLASDTFHRSFTDIIPVTALTAALPDMQGSGRVRDLRQAASLTTVEGTTLAGALGQFAAATRTNQRAQLDTLLADWAANDAMFSERMISA